MSLTSYFMTNQEVWTWLPSSCRWKCIPNFFYSTRRKHDVKIFSQLLPAQAG